VSTAAFRDGLSPCAPTSADFARAITLKCLPGLLPEQQCLDRSARLCSWSWLPGIRCPLASGGIWLPCLPASMRRWRDRAAIEPASRASRSSRLLLGSRSASVSTLSTIIVRRANPWAAPTRSTRALNAGAPPALWVER
jgi:hypothetical protein